MIQLIFSLFLTTDLVHGETIHFAQALEAICQDCAVDAWVDVASADNISSYQNPIRITPSKELVLLVPSGGQYEQGASLALNIALSALEKTQVGRNLMSKIVHDSTSDVLVKLFFEVPISNDRPIWGRPMWVTERNSRHELYGAFDSDGHLGVIALNNYQYRHIVPYTFIHELFHLLDGNMRTGDAIIDNFLAEYRAILTEVRFHQEIKGKFSASKWHDQFLGMFTNTESAVFKKTLDLLYPENPDLVAIDKDSFHFLLDQSHSTTKVGFTDNKNLIQSQRESNRATRKYIETFFTKNKNLLDIKFTENLRPSGLNTFDSIGGPRPRGPGG